MPRPEKFRWIRTELTVDYFKPQGIPLRNLEQVELTRDELEALRLADLERLTQEEAAVRMNISRPTFSRIAAKARHKVADGLVNGKAIQIRGGTVKIHPSPSGGQRRRHGKGWHGGR